ncbi:MAG: leucine-responsive regulatory protein [Osedax symbiont Rs1]|nr:MAG: leucine-responsive regulatory protein [Osedax symbiont Rs1]
MFLDRLDKAILRQLQTDAGISNVQLAALVGLSPPACLKRVKRLEKSAVINKRVALLDQAKLGNSLHMIVEIMMQQDRMDLNAAFIKCIRDADEVHQCYKVTGEVDFVLVVVVPGMPSYESFCERVIYSNSNLRNFRTLISMNRVKYDTKVHIPD